ncbi:hypothetical protein DVH24_038567 [Malus domestica]|uniref:Uncharacterized protein n=1 Tax=Malus domestica TaxID=3750 RepID=A0A498KFP8_MALDO|nr:hypothetical protein DVH24_038567 [Malus domestica]
MYVSRAQNSNASTGLQGFDITVFLTMFNFLNPSDYSDFDFLRMSDGLCEQNAWSYNFIALRPLQSLTAGVIGSDSEELANHIGLPSIILITSSVVNTLTYQAIPRLLKHGYIPIQRNNQTSQLFDFCLDINYEITDSTMLELVPGLQPLRFKDLPISNFKCLDDLLQLVAKAHDSRSSSGFSYHLEQHGLPLTIITGKAPARVSNSIVSYRSSARNCSILVYKLVERWPELYDMVR